MKKITTKEIKDNYGKLKLKELKKICGEKGLSKYSRLNKASLVELLENME